MEAQKKAVRDAELFECGYEMFHEQLREEDESRESIAQIYEQTILLAGPGLH
ncbi:MAG: hypothetical protein ACR2N0_15225 [Rubrobacteraceae bacterium]